MKKITLTLVALVMMLCCAFGLAACGDNGGSGAGNKKVDYVNLGVRAISIDINEEQAVSVNVIPVSAKYELTCSASPEGIVEVKTGTTIEGEKGGEWETEAIIVKGLTHGNATVTVTAGEISNTFDVVVETVTKGLEYDIYSTDEYSTSGDYEQIAWCRGLGTATETDIVVASVYFGTPVSRVAFPDEADQAKLTGVTVPATVKDVTLYNCPALTKVNIPDTATSLQRLAINACSSISSISLPNSLTDVEISFGRCASLSNVTLPSGLKKISNSAFEDCTSLTTIVIPNSVTSIGGGAFWGCTNLESVYLGKGLKEIGNNAFYDCNKITTLELLGLQFAGNSSSAQIADLFNLKSESSSLRKITVADGVTVLLEGAFSDCTYLTELELPSTLTAIQDNVISGCRNLTAVRFNGTVGRWQNIAGYWMPNSSSDLIIYCINGTIAHGMIYNETA